VQTYGHTAVPTNYRDVNGSGQREVREFLSNESRSADDIQGGDTKEPETRVGSVSR